MPELDLDARRRIHVTNIGGAGMSAVATLLAEMGHAVSGHDPKDGSPFLPPLRALGVAIDTGEPVPDLDPAVDVVVVSTATPDDHPQVVAARGRDVAVLHRSSALHEICARRRTIAVAGTHGKTTTSALLATVLAGAGQQPGWVVGGGVTGLGRSAAWGSGEVLVVEADESDGTFLALSAHAAIVTNVEPDHLEHWGTESALRDAFRSFVRALDGPAVLCLDDPGAASLVDEAAHPITYGRDPGADHVIEAVRTEGTEVRFVLRSGGEAHDVVVPAAPGAHNAANAAAAIAAAAAVGVPIAAAVEAIGGFRGVARRFEPRGEAGGVTFVDSYDHLPSEVMAALRTAHEGGWRRVVCVFQPHRYSRTQALWRTFADAFVDADLLCITDVYAAGEAPRPGVTGKLVVDAVLDAHPWASVAYLPSLDDVVGYLRTALRPGDLCLTLGAGDLTEVPPRVQAALRKDDS